MKKKCTVRNVLSKIIFIGVGVFSFVIFLEIALRIEGVIASSFFKRTNTIDLDAHNRCIILCLGESNTAWGGEASYPTQLEQALNTMSVDIEFTVINEGMPGVTSTAIVNRLEDYLDTYVPDIVVVMMGANDEKGAYGKLYETKNVTLGQRCIRTFKIYRLIRFLQANIKDKKRANFFERTEIELRESIVKNPNVQAYDMLGQCLRKQGKKQEAMSLFAKAVEMDGYPPAYLHLALTYRDQEKFHKEEEMLKQGIKKFPYFRKIYVMLNSLYRERGRYDDAENLFKSAITTTGSGWAHAYLACYYNGMRQYKKAEALFKKATEIQPTDRTYAEWGVCYRQGKRYREAEEMLKHSLNINPTGRAYVELGLCYKDMGRESETEEMFKKAIQGGTAAWDYAEPGMEMRNPGIELAYSELAHYYREREMYHKSAQMIKNITTGSVTRRNYLTLRTIVMQRVGKLVCVQYPMRSVEPLKKMIPEEEGIVFVDNEKIFKDAVERDGYNAYFIDRHLGDIGHCTKKGNRLLAKNIAEVIRYICQKKK